MGEKALKPVNLLTGRAVYPKGTYCVAVVLSVLALIVGLDILRSEGRSTVSAALVPLLFAAWLLSTLGLCGWLYRPCRLEGAWMPSVSELSVFPPMRNFYRVGFMFAGALLAQSIWLYSELLMANLAEMPPMPSAAPAPPLMSAEPADVAGAEESAEAVDPEAENEELLEETDEAKVVKPKEKNMTRLLALHETLRVGPETSTWWGYGAAAGLFLQGVVPFDGRLSVRSVLHLGTLGGCVAGALQHSVISNTLLLSARGRHFWESSPLLHQVIKLRQNMTDYAPLVLLGMPLTSQYMTFQRRGKAVDPSATKFRDLLKDTGLTKAMGLTQWLLMLVYAVFYGSFSVDYWVVSNMLRD